MATGSNVLPDLTGHNLVDQAVVHTKSSRQDVTRISSRNVKRSDLQNLLLGELRVAVPFPLDSRNPIFRVSIPHVIKVSSQEEVCRSKAFWVIAVMADLHLCRNRATVQRPSQSINPPRLSEEHHRSVAPPVTPRASPLPTRSFVSSINDRPPTIKVGFELLNRHALTTNTPHAIRANLNAIGEFHAPFGHVLMPKSTDC